MNARNQNDPSANGILDGMSEQLQARPLDQRKSDLQAQNEYAERLIQSGFNFQLLVADAFVRGIRDIGYKSTATALNELIDNSFQAGAENVHVIFGFDGPSNKPSKLAIIDDGHGMSPEMLRLAPIWGGTHRENDRTGFGRYGYGLPSSCVSQGRRFTVYSRTDGEQFRAVTLDIDDIGAGNYHDDHGQIVVPPPVDHELPSWVQEYIQDHSSDLTDGYRHGTVIIIEKLDRLSWTTTDTLKRNLLQNFSVVYQNFIPRLFKIWVDGRMVEPIDPLFLTPGHRFYDFDEDRAQPLEPAPPIEVRDDTGNIVGVIKVRYAYFPQTFPRQDKSQKLGAKGRNANPRWAIMKDYGPGLKILRHGRLIDTVTRAQWDGGVFQNNDRYWAIDIDFPPALDREFSITTSKQQVMISERIWKALEAAGVRRTIETLRKKYDQDKSEADTKEEQVGGKRASEQAMEDAQKFKVRRPSADAVERRWENFAEEADRRSQESGRPLAEVESELQLEVMGHPYKVETESIPGGIPFYRVEALGGQTVLYLNTSHRFYTEVYAGPWSNPQVRAALEVLLFVMGECELDSTDDRQLFYQQERVAWSVDLNAVLNRLSLFDNVKDAQERAEARAENDDSDQQSAASQLALANR